jgi:hypothetical protein
MPIDPKPCFVAFVDLLGYSARVRAVETRENVEEIARDVRKVLEFFGHNRTDDAGIQYHEAVGKKVLAFSDCVVVSVSYVSDFMKSGGTFDAPMSELHSLALNQAECVMNGIFLRGGVGFGYWANEDNLIVSDAMVTAYEVENRACVPVIAVDLDYGDSLAEQGDRRFYSDSADPFLKLFQKAEIGDDQTPIWFLNYFWVLLDALDGALNDTEKADYKGASSERRNELRSTAYWRAHRECCQKHARLIRDAHEATKVESIRYKYAWLARYHGKVVREYYAEPSPELLCDDIALPTYA